MSASELLAEALSRLDAILDGVQGKLNSRQKADKGAIAISAMTRSAWCAVESTAVQNSASAAPAAAAATKPASIAAETPRAAAPAATSSTSDCLFHKANIKVARVLSVEELANSEKLYKLQVDVGGETRQVCAGLRQYIAKEQLQGLLVCCVLNLKPAKLAGELSEAMILAADAEISGTTVVRTLVPPDGSEPGDIVYPEPNGATTAPAKQLKSDDWKKTVVELAVAGSKACWAGKPLVTAKGAVTVPAEIPDGAGIH